MKRETFFVFVGIFMLTAPSMAAAQQGSWGSVLKTAGQAAVVQMSPQAQTTVDQAKKLTSGASRENFIVTKAKEYIAAGNYQSALDLANYVLTTINSKSISAQKIMTDAKAALLKIVQDKMAQSQQQAVAQQNNTAAGQAVSGLQNLFGAQK